MAGARKVLFLLEVVPGRTVEGHGFMTEPRSREEDHLKGDIRGWPIAGVPPRLTKLPCLDIGVNKQFTEIHPGPLQLKFFFGDGANHVGLCQVFLLNRVQFENRSRFFRPEAPSGRRVP